MSLSALAEVLPRPYFDEGGVFRLGQPQEVLSLPLSDSLRVFAFSEALPHCAEPIQKLDGYLSEFVVRPESYVRKALSKFVANVSDSSFTNVRIFFDFFGTRSKMYRSFYVHPRELVDASISLDCSRLSKYALPVLVGHELIHHLNHDRDLSPWIDEMMAQQVEAEIAEGPLFDLHENISHDSQVLSFFAREMPFKNSKEYAINSLFGSFVSSRYGAAVFRAIPNGTQSLGDFAVVLKTEPRLLIRQFVLSLNSGFEIPGWGGFAKSALIEKPGTYHLESGGFLRIDSKWSSNFVQPISTSSLEVYRVLKSGKNTKIQSVLEAVSGKWNENFLLLINTSETEQFEIEFK
ncbi:hypothetical protein [Bdellovibrio sp. HCB2-146]|uniref:hypothetical protein n=1 Tax=Bdellovibrio sp. HCB2-146 TaxID=3394362 RepID=UPI0039BC78A7